MCLIPKKARHMVLRRILDIISPHITLVKKFFNSQECCIIKRGIDKTYSDISHFLSVYPCFEYRSEDEQLKLLSNANWMKVVFQFVKPVNNKELVLSVVTKFVGK